MMSRTRTHRPLTHLALVLAVALGVVGAGTAHARPDAARRPMVADKNANQAAKRERVKQRIRIMRGLVLTEQLGLDEATAGKMFPILGKYDDELAKLLAERATLRAKLAAARAGGKPADIAAALDRLVANQRARWTAEEQRFADLRGLLTPEQGAILLDVLPEVDRKILRALRGAVDAGADVGEPRPRARGKNRDRGGRRDNPFNTR